MTKHTPGPWRVCDQDSDNIHIGTKPMNHKIPWEYTTICNLYDDVTPKDFVTFGPWLRQHENAKANARLIAASPDLLAMLENVTNELTATYAACKEGQPIISIGQFGRLEAARQLIAQVKGEV